MVKPLGEVTTSASKPTKITIKRLVGNAPWSDARRWCVSSVLILAACGGGSSSGGADTGATPVVGNDGSPVAFVLISDISYGKTSVNQLDIYQPSDICDVPRPTVFFVHGGGFRSGDKVGNAVSDRAGASLDNGFNFVSINYRLEGDNPVLAPEFQAIYDDLAVQDPPSDPDNRNAEIAAIEDSVDALNFLVANADQYCLDMDRLAYWGSSAGATNVLSLGYRMDQFGIDRPAPDVVINYWGDLRRDEDLHLMEAPFLTIHGDADSTILYQVAVDLADQANAIGVPYAFYTDVNGEHNVDTEQTVNGVTLLELTVDFIEAHVIGGMPLYEIADVD